MDIRLSRASKDQHKIILLHLQGRLDSFNYENLKSRVSTLLKMGEKSIGFDLDGVDFVATPTLIFIINLSKTLKQQKSGQLYFLKGSKCLKSHFERVGGLKNIVCTDSIEALTSSLDSGEAVL
jgi:anti-anti-sigma factor